jgi:MFS family permease
MSTKNVGQVTIINDGDVGENTQLTVDIDNDQTSVTPDQTSLTPNRGVIMIWICIVGIIISGGIQGVILPLITISFPSEYFIILFSSFEVFLILLGIMIYCYFRHDKTIFVINEWSYVLTLVIAGVISGLMVAAKTYASNPILVSPVIQSTLVSSTVVFSFIFSKLFLNKETKYNYVYIAYSILALVGSILLPLVYSFIVEEVKGHILWVLLYLFGVICRSVFPVFQEKYFIQSGEYGTLSKIKLLFYVNTIQLIVVIPVYGFEYVIGDSTTPGLELLDSLKILFTVTEPSLAFHGFIVSFFMFLGFAIYLNTISSNYIMIACAVITPVVMIFFIIFKNIMPGIIFPLYVVLPSLALSVTSAVLWILGEGSHK